MVDRKLQIPRLGVSSAAHMANLGTRSIGMLLLGIYLILVGVVSLMALAVPPMVMGVLALVAGIFILIGR